MLSWFVIEYNLKIIKLGGRELLEAGTYNDRNFYNYESRVQSGYWVYKFGVIECLIFYRFVQTFVFRNIEQKAVQLTMLAKTLLERQILKEKQPKLSRCLQINR